MTPGRGEVPEDDGDDLLELGDLPATDDDTSFDLDEDEPLGTDLGDWSSDDDDDLDLGEVDDGDPSLADLDPGDGDEEPDPESDAADDDDDPALSWAVVAWRGVASLPALDLEVPCVCDPTASRSTLTLPEPPDTPRLELDVRYGGLALTTLLDIVAGPEAHLRLGRDVLSGRALIRP